MSLAPGLAVVLEPAADYPGTARPEGKHFVVEATHLWRREPAALSHEVTAIPIDTPYRLPRITPRPILIIRSVCRVMPPECRRYCAANPG